MGFSYHRLPYKSVEMCVFCIATCNLLLRVKDSVLSVPILKGSRLFKLYLSIRLTKLLFYLHIITLNVKRPKSKIITFFLGK